MTITLSQVQDFILFYHKISGEMLPLEVSFKLARTYKACQDQFGFYQTEWRKIITLYCDLDEAGNPIQLDNGFKIGPEKRADCEAALADLANFNVEIPDCQISIKTLPAGNFTPEELSGVLEFLTD